jgi:hypothetical protein
VDTATEGEAERTAGCRGETRPCRVGCAWSAGRSMALAVCADEPVRARDCDGATARSSVTVRGAATDTRRLASTRRAPAGSSSRSGARTTVSGPFAPREGRRVLSDEAGRDDVRSAGRTISNPFVAAGGVTPSETAFPDAACCGGAGCGTGACGGTACWVTARAAGAGPPVPAAGDAGAATGASTTTAGEDTAVVDAAGVDAAGTGAGVVVAAGPGAVARGVAGVAAGGSADAGEAAAGGDAARGGKSDAGSR